MIGVVAAVKTKDKSDPCLVTALEVIAAAGVRIEIIAGHWVEVTQEAKATQQAEATQEVIVSREQVRVVQRVRGVAAVEVEIKI